MSIKIYNTLTGKKEQLRTIEPNQVKLYVCGITSYDYCHIGHARSALAFDMMVKYLQYCGYKVTYVRNFTDIDDKIIARANELGISAEELASRFIDEFYTDMARLGVSRPDLEPKATEHIQEMIDFISELIEKGKAYQAGNDVYFAVESFADYGLLSHRKLEDMQAGARIAVNRQKKNPMDFVLWKGAKPGEPKWDSPWGAGRPGWHIECSAMSRKYLGETFDIHGGGKDLVFPHHENEIAQSQSCHGKPFANLWIHHGFVTIKDEKMSKSLGNFLTIRDVLDNYHPEVLRFFIFSTQYRTPLDFSETAMQNAMTGLDRLYESVAEIEKLKGVESNSDEKSAISAKDLQKLTSLEDRFQQAMNNDFNTAQAQGIFFDTIKIINKVRAMLPPVPAACDKKLLLETVEKLKTLGGIMGILTEDAKLYLAERKAKMLAGLEIDEETIEALIARRNAARADKNWAECDQIRDELARHRIELQDLPDGTKWSVKPLS
ncbi:MAG: cysteine--tRNA ligase [Deltaproteobacteria bacterium]|nr:MAG: cysteine--tRNA ligase [Deltaproteobacteria bacterium]